MLRMRLDGFPLRLESVNLKEVGDEFGDDAKPLVSAATQPRTQDS